MNSNYFKNRLLEPYEDLGEEDLSALNTVFSRQSEPSDVKDALNHLLDLIQSRSSDVSMKEARTSLAKAGADLSKDLQELDKASRSGRAHAVMVKRFRKLDASDDGGPDTPEMIRHPKRRDDDLLE